MAPKTLYWQSALASGSGFHALVDGGAAPADAPFSPATGWIIGTTPVGDMSALDSQTERATTAFDTTLKPLPPDNALGNGARTPTALKGQFNAGNWTFPFGVRSDTAAYNGDIRFRIRVWRSANANGSGATEITTSTIIGASTTAGLSTSVTTTVTATWAAPAFILDNEYLFFTVACEVTNRTSIGGTKDANLRLGMSNIVTTNFLATLVIAPPVTDVLVESLPTVIRLGKRIQPLVTDVPVDSPAVVLRRGRLIQPPLTDVVITAFVPKLATLPSPVKALQDEFARERDALMGLRGALHFEPHLFLSNIQADELAELPGVLGASVNVDNDRAYTWELALDCLPTDAFDPLRDWVLVALDVSTDMDPPKRYYLGLYRFDFPAGADDPEGGIWQLTGMSPEFILMRDDINEIRPVPAARYILQEVRSTINLRGIPLNRITMPWSEDQQTATNKTYGGGATEEVKTWLDLVNALLKAGGFHHLQTDNLGSPVARKIRLPQTAAPSVFYGPREREIGLPIPANFLGRLLDRLPAYKGNDMIVYAPITREPDYSRFANEVTVESADVNQQGTEPMPASGTVPETTPTTDGPPVRAIVRNKDPKSPLSILPSGLGYVVSKTETLDNVANRRTCKEIARRLLMVSSTYYNKRSFSTMLDPRRTYDEVYLVEATNGQGVQVMDGRWQCLSWNLPLPVGGAPDVQTHNVGRDESIVDYEEIG